MVGGDRDGDELASASTDALAASNSPSDHPPSGNVSGSAVSNQFFSKKLEGVLESREGREFSNARAWRVYS
jgi:hypothetical protein